MTYDAVGNMTARSNTVDGTVYLLEYDVANRLVQLEERDQTGTLINEVRYLYDAIGRRLAREENGIVTYTVYDFRFAHADLDASTNVVAVYLNSGQLDERYGRYRPGDGLHWHLVDRMQNVRQLADASGSVVSEIDYTAFGEILSISNPAATDRFLWAGRDYEPVGSFYFFHYRQHDPVLKRFTSTDPIGYTLGEYNLYRYAANNPINRIDWLGWGPAIEYPWPLPVQVFLVGCIQGVGESFVCDIAKTPIKMGIGAAGADAGGGGAAAKEAFWKEWGSDGIGNKAWAYMFDCGLGGIVNVFTGPVPPGVAGKGLGAAAGNFSLESQGKAVLKGLREAGKEAAAEAIKDGNPGKSAGLCLGSLGMDFMGDNKPFDEAGKIGNAIIGSVLFN